MAVEKPLLVRRKDLADDVTTLITKTELPAIMMIDIFQNAVEVLRQMNVEQERMQIIEYERRISEEAKKHLEEVRNAKNIEAREDTMPS